MDKIDKQILNILQTNARASLKEIGEATFLSSPAISARIAQLERNGVITDYGAHVNLQTLGYNIKAFINLEVDPKQKPVFYPFVDSIPNVLECNCVTGEFSMLLMADAGLVAEDELSADYIIPKAFDKRVGPAVAEAVAKAARETGVARI